MSIERRTVVVTIYPGDYLDRIRHLEARADAAQQAEETALTRTNDEVPEYLKLAEEHDKLVTEAEAAATHVRVQALPRRVWKALVAEHPPRAEVKGDAVTGVNEDTFKDALVYPGVVAVDGVETPYASIIEPALSQADIDELSDIDFDRIYFSAFNVNRAAVGDPKASLVSRLTQTSSETSA